MLKTRINLGLACILISTGPLLIAAEGCSPISWYNPGKEGVFPVTSSLIHDGTESILFDAQFSPKHAEKLITMIAESKTTLKLIIISCGDPDYYFGLEAIVEAYPNVKIVSSPKVSNYINTTKDAKLQRWAPTLGNLAPNKLYVPVATSETQFTVNGVTIEMRRQLEHAAYFWISSNKIIFGGVAVSWGIHVFTADTQTPELRANWRTVLQEMIDLQPNRVIPGHYLGAWNSDKPIRFTLKYLETFENVLQANNYKNSTAVIEAMKTAYPDLGMESSLELSAKVNTGEVTF